MAVLPNSRFIGIAQVAIAGAPQAIANVTVREQPGLQASILEGWSFSGGAAPVQSRSVAWSSDYRVQGIGSNQSVTYVAGRGSLSIMAEEISPATLARIGPQTSLTTLASGSDAGVTRVNLFTAPLAPVLVWVGHGTNSTLHRMETQNTFVSVLTSTSTGVIQGDDVIEAPTMGLPNRWVATSRCTGDCSFLTVTSSGTGTVGRLMWGPYSTSTASLNPPTLFTTIVGSPGGVAVFDPGSPIRVASDGNSAIYLAGQGPGGTLVVERRDAMMGMREALFTSTGPLRLADVTRAQNGVGIYLLVSWSQVVSFAGASIPSANGNQGNVGVIRIDSMTGVTSSLFDIALDQQAVAFAKNGAFLTVAVHEGSNAVLWRIPAP